MITAQRLENDRVVLEPFADLNDFEYLYDLANHYRFNTLTRQEMEEDVTKYGYMFWTVFARSNNNKVGVVFLQNIGAWFHIAAFRDDRACLLAAQLEKKSPARNYEYVNYSLETMVVLLPFIQENVTPVIHIVYNAKDLLMANISRTLKFDKVSETTSRHGRFIITQRDLIKCPAP